MPRLKDDSGTVLIYIGAHYNRRRRLPNNGWLFPATFEYRNGQYVLVA